MFFRTAWVVSVTVRVNFNTSLPISLKKNHCSNFDWDFTESVDQLRENAT